MRGVGKGLCLAASLLLACLAGPAMAQLAAPCPVPDELKPDPAPLPAIKAKLAAGDEVRIVALGGGGTLGRAVPAGQAYPDRLAAWLQYGLPAARWQVINKGVVGDSTAAMVKRIHSEVLDLKPSLVLWETGTHEAAIGSNVEAFGEAVQSGIEALRAAKIDLILIDMQYSPRTSSVINFDPYLNALREVAEQNDVGVDDRYQLMHAWTDAGLFDFHTRDAAKRAEATRRIYDCVAAGLAQMIFVDLK
jgi:acyl-CoA thioesterase I